MNYAVLLVFALSCFAIQLNYCPNLLIIHEDKETPLDAANYVERSAYIANVHNLLQWVPTKVSNSGPYSFHLKFPKSASATLFSISIDAVQFKGAVETPIILSTAHT
jgi:hypothetical protein